ncbi:hypothetical protein [Paenibacillus sp. NEAU-GSW1]|uniref:hypothetical protein n=1 Tax=Paenibacillus sp. NEAU-GSW1 TaxID=2682486 RepID=UPI0012E0E44A|nr:hypothetical protein [Paenibacillus sp. NEAU-GSW1]MUT66565.1 hypothetical protein [Paenibacillus sp. NEAU-GSW1]
MLELHDLFPYLFSISVICSFAYAAYFTHQALEWNADPSRSKVVRILLIPLVQQVDGSNRSPQWLISKTKRKESPDDDSSDCAASLFDHNRPNNEEDFHLYEQPKCTHRFFQTICA